VSSLWHPCSVCRIPFPDVASLADHSKIHSSTSESVDADVDTSKEVDLDFFIFKKCFLLILEYGVFRYLFIYFFITLSKSHFFHRKLSKIAENYDHNIDPLLVRECFGIKLKNNWIILWVWTSKKIHCFSGSERWAGPPVQKLREEFQHQVSTFLLCTPVFFPYNRG
jgi:hypothetical protein